MCGRYVLYAPPHKLKDFFGCENLANFPPSYNAAPIQDLPIIVKNRMGLARWGLLPEWVKEDDKSLAVKMINARSETVTEKPAFRELWRKGRRCLVPANGFYEWHKENDRNQPYYIKPADSELCAFAGLWCKAADLVTFTVLTMPASNDIQGLHHRMPVTFLPEDAKSWLNGDSAQAFELVQNKAIQRFHFHKVSAEVGKVQHNGPALLQEKCA